MIAPEQLEWAIENDIEFYVFDEQRLKRTLAVADKMGKQAKLHIEVETGMNRTGFPPKKLQGVLNLLKQNQNSLCFQGLCTHYAGAESITNYYRIRKQQQAFDRAIKTVTASGLNPIQKHSAWSSLKTSIPTKVGK